MGMQISMGSLENSLVASYKTKRILTTLLSNRTPC